MDKVFKALADGHRRTLLDRLRSRNGRTLYELCDGLDLSRQAVSKHLRLLQEAELIAVEWRGRKKLHYLNAAPIHAIYDRWIGKFERKQIDAVAALKKALEGAAPEKPWKTSPISSTSRTSRRTRNESGRP